MCSLRISLWAQYARITYGTRSICEKSRHVDKSWNQAKYAAQMFLTPWLILTNVVIVLIPFEMIYNNVVYFAKMEQLRSDIFLPLLRKLFLTSLPLMQSFRDRFQVKWNIHGQSTVYCLWMRKTSKESIRVALLYALFVTNYDTLDYICYSFFIIFLT